MNISTNGFTPQDNSMNLLQKLRGQQIQWSIPTFVWLFVICSCGILGNSFMLYMYWTKFPLSNYKVFIITVSVIDLLVCSTAIPLEIVLMFKGYTFTNSGHVLCKVSRFCNVFVTYSSNLILGLIAVDRYKKVCRPLQSQITPTLAIKLSVVFIVIGLLLSVPSFELSGNRSFKHVVDGYPITVKGCSISDVASREVITLVYLAFLFLLAVVLIVLDVVMYVRIVCKINSTCASSKPSASTPTASGFEMQAQGNSNLSNYDTEDIRACKIDDFGYRSDTSVQSVRESCLVERKADEMSSDALTSFEVNYENRTLNILHLPSSTVSNINLNIDVPEKQDKQDAISSRTKNKKPSGKTSFRTILRVRTRRSVFVMFVISLVYIVSYMPNLIIISFSSLNKEFDDDMDLTTRAVVQLFIRSYFITFGINPFICLFCDSRLRNATKEFLHVCKRRK